ncbi:carboxylic ester hydrolase-like [Palaemon carinicauda]|uniref:carboxylic ester hydrolase-like n=1 Tax=Palaemon carinicauda TaxID=392227 RepID=UPI0035B65582
MISFMKLYLVLTYLCMSAVGAKDVEVTLPGGEIIRGTTEYTIRKGRKYNAFRAIPYAQPPIEKNRFLPTIPGFKWDGVFDATQPGKPCAQAAFGMMDGTEDCLNLYVYTPQVRMKKNNSALLPVIVWIHGGSFVSGSAAAIQESFLMERNVVLVIPQYRLGYLGFLKTKGSFPGGNMGLMDQQAALNWVQKNVVAFGGNAHQVILAGEDAGGAAAIYHMLSPLSEGLFHGVISFSGSPLAPWAYMKHEHRFNLMVANVVKCPSYDPDLMVKCFQETDVFELLNVVQMLMETRDPVVGNDKMGPTAQDAEHATETTLVIPDHPLKLLSAGKFHKVPVVMGVTRDVGGYLVDMLLYEFIKFHLEDDPSYLDGLLAMLLKECDIRNASLHEKEFRDFYFPNNEFNDLESLLPGLMKMLGDIHYKSSILSTARVLSEYVPVWMYRFEYEGGPNLFDVRFPDPSSAPPMPPAVGHGDEVLHILPEVDLAFDPYQREMSEELLDVVENFAYGRLPYKDWPLFSDVTFETLVWKADGSRAIKPFATSEAIEMLDKIHTYHHEKILGPLREKPLQAATDIGHEEL